jgi:hypothetical protein
VNGDRLGIGALASVRKSDYRHALKKVVRATGIEPVTPTMSR